MPDTTPDNLAGQVYDYAATAAEALRSINHLTIGRHPIPAPEMYRTLGELERLTFGLNQALRQLGHSLGASLGAYQVYDEPGTDPETSVDNARDCLDDAAHHVSAAGHAIGAACTQIAGQGYHDTTEDER